MKKTLICLAALLPLIGCAHRRADYASGGEYADEYYPVEPGYADGYAAGGLYPDDFTRDCYDSYLDSIPRPSRLVFPCNDGSRQPHGLRHHSYSPTRPSTPQRQSVHLAVGRPHPRNVTRQSTTSTSRSSSASVAPSSHSSSASHSSSSHSSHR